MWTLSATKKSLISACLVTVGLILGYLEHVFLPLPFWGLKIGLSNLPLLFALCFLRADYVYTIGFSKAVLSGVLFSGLTSSLYSCAGIFLAVSVMLCVKKTKKCSIIGVSVAGSGMFQVGQTLVACFLLSSDAPLFYLAYLLIGSVPCGIISAVLVKWIGARLRFFKEYIDETEIKS